MSLLLAVNKFFIYPLLTLLVWVIIINAILSWLVAFRVVNPHNQLAATIGRFTDQVTYPLLSPLRRVVPPLGGIDITPVILILAIFFVRDWVIPQILLALLGATGGA